MKKTNMLIAAFAVLAAASADRSEEAKVEFDGKMSGALITVSELKSADAAELPVANIMPAKFHLSESGPAADSLCTPAVYLLMEGNKFTIGPAVEAGAFEEAKPVSFLPSAEQQGAIKVLVLNKMAAEAKKSFMEILSALRQNKAAPSRYEFGDCWDGKETTQQLSGGALRICKLVCCLASEDTMHNTGVQGRPTCKKYCEDQK